MNPIEYFRRLFASRPDEGAGAVGLLLGYRECMLAVRIGCLMQRQEHRGG